MTWLAASEVVAGLVIERQISPAAVDPKMLAKPYDQIVAALAKDRKLTAPQLEVQYSSGEVAAALAAAEAITGKDASEWLNVLRTRYLYAQAAKGMAQDVRRLERGEEIDVAAAMNRLRHLNNYDQLFQTADLILPETEYYMRSGFGPFDKYGLLLPKAGLLTLAGLPKTGKTQLAMALVNALIRKKRRCLIFTYEVPANAWIGMFLARYPDAKPYLKYLTLYQGRSIPSPEEWQAMVYQMNSEVGGYDLNVADVAGMMLNGEDEQGMTHLYKIGGETGRGLAQEHGKACVLFTAQFNANAYQEGTVPKADYIRYGKMVVAYSSDIWLIHNGNVAWTSASKGSLPTNKGRAWVIHPVARFGFGEDTHGERAAGAVELDYTGKGGWGATAHRYRDVTTFMG